MSDSLRDQLLKAGFAKPKPKQAERAKRKPAGNSSGQTRRGTSTKPGNDKPAQAGASNPPQTEPKAGYTHVATQAPRKKKKKKAPAIKPRAGSWSTRAHADVAKVSSTGNAADVEKRRAMKAEIQVLIESSALKAHTGEHVYRFTLQNKIRELPVTQAIRAQLVNGELAITRLNGATHLIPVDTAAAIRAINPQWLLFVTTDTDKDSGDEDDYPIPDDLVW